MTSSKQMGRPKMEPGERVTVRIPEKLLERLKQSAVEQSRSLTGEVVVRLKETFKGK